MPTVTVQNPSSGTVSRSIQTNGTISYAGGTPFTLPAGLLVTGVPVQVGQHVKAGDTLATFDTEELARAVASKQAALQQDRYKQHSRRKAIRLTLSTPSLRRHSWSEPTKKPKKSTRTGRKV